MKKKTVQAFCLSLAALMGISSVQVPVMADTTETVAVYEVNTDETSVEVSVPVSENSISENIVSDEDTANEKNVKENHSDTEMHSLEELMSLDYTSLSEDEINDFFTNAEDEDVWVFYSSLDDVQKAYVSQFEVFSHSVEVADFNVTEEGEMSTDKFERMTYLDYLKSMYGTEKKAYNSSGHCYVGMYFPDTPNDASTTQKLSMSCTGGDTTKSFKVTLALAEPSSWVKTGAYMYYTLNATTKTCNLKDTSDRYSLLYVPLTIHGNKGFSYQMEGSKKVSAGGGTMSLLNKADGTGTGWEKWHASADFAETIYLYINIWKNTTMGNYEGSTDKAVAGRVYLKRMPNSYTMSYHSNGGSGAVGAQVCNYMKTYAYPNSPTPPNYTVTYNANGGSTNSANASVPRTFLGWNTNSAATSGYTGNFVNATPVHGATVVNYAIYGGAAASVTLPSASKSVTVNFNTNGGSCDQPSATANAIFNGWGSGPSTGANIGRGGASYAPLGNVTLYAQFTEKNMESVQQQKEKIRQRYKGVDKELIRVIPMKPQTKLFEDTREKRVVAYCRVSTENVQQTSSYELQKNFYEEMIKEKPGWKLVGIYADEGISGTSVQHRVEFNRMIQDCIDGKIDLIVTKSVSRFARNIVDSIDTQRMLANLNPPVGVFFETEHIYSLDSTSEMMMAVLSAAAQEESHTKSLIMNASIEQRFSRGIFLTPKLLGYDLDEEGNYILNEEEADTVKLCYYLILNGFSPDAIAEILTQLKRKTKKGRTTWSASSVRIVLLNERHCGDVLSRKTFTPDYLTHKSKKNNNERNQYEQRDHHEAIVSREVFQATLFLLKCKGSGSYHKYPFLKVIDTGILKGYVPINLQWKGFSLEEYVYATEYANAIGKIGTDGRKDENTFQKKYNGPRLLGYQLVRSSLFRDTKEMSMTIRKNQIKFSVECIRKFHHCKTVELLFHPIERKLAIRAVDETSWNAIFWSREQQDKVISVARTGSAFVPTLMEYMDWDSKLSYKLFATYYENENDCLMIFDMKEPEIKEGKEAKYPENWWSDFGEDTGSYHKSLASQIRFSDVMKIDAAAVTVEREHGIDEDDLQEMYEQAMELIDKMKASGREALEDE